jgi:hypothetical protein
MGDREGDVFDAVKESNAVGAQFTIGFVGAQQAGIENG